MVPSAAPIGDGTMHDNCSNSSRHIFRINLVRVSNRSIRGSGMSTASDDRKMHHSILAFCSTLSMKIGIRVECRVGSFGTGVDDNSKMSPRPDWSEWHNSSISRDSMRTAVWPILCNFPDRRHCQLQLQHHIHLRRHHLLLHGTTSKDAFDSRPKWCRVHADTHAEHTTILIPNDFRCEWLAICSYFDFRPDWLFRKSIYIVRNIKISHEYVEIRERHTHKSGSLWNTASISFIIFSQTSLLSYSMLATIHLPVSRQQTRTNRKKQKTNGSQTLVAPTVDQKQNENGNFNSILFIL